MIISRPTLNNIQISRLNMFHEHRSHQLRLQYYAVQHGTGQNNGWHILISRLNMFPEHRSHQLNLQRNTVMAEGRSMPGTS
jgi:hypothetical protein